MKRLKYLVILLMAVLFIPFVVFAEGEEVTTTGEENAATEESKEVNVYFFRGEGCPHCQEAEEWFASIEEEYGSYFKIVDYEVWNDEDNSALMTKVAEARGEKAEGVPYIIIGDKSWSGFAEDYEQEIIDQITKVFAQDVNQRYDIMKYVETGTTPKKEKTGSNDIVVLLVILLVCGGAGFGIYQARKTAK